MGVRVLSDFYYGERARHCGMLSEHLVMPEVSQESYFDLRVLAQGPGRLDSQGRLIGMQAVVGDRILCDPAAFQHYEPGNPNTRKGFVSDRHLLGVIRAETGHAALEPAADLLLIDPDPRQSEETLASGVVVVKSDSLPGDEARQRERGFELLEQYSDLLQSQKYAEEPTIYDKWKRERDFIEPLSPSDREAFEAARKDQAQKQMRMGVRGARIVLDKAQYTAQAPMRLRERLMSGRIVGMGPEAEVDATLGERIRWSHGHTVTRVAVGGILRLLIPSKFAIAALE